MDNFEEFYINKYYSTKLEKDLDAWATKAGLYCFIKFGPKSETLAIFFFECSLLLLGKAFYREMNHNCEYPNIKPIIPVIEEVCYMQVKKAQDIVEVSIDAYGEGNSEAVISCYVESLTKHTKGDIETMCTKEAIVEGWNALS